MSYYNNMKKYGRVNTGMADRFFSERILDPNEMVCPIPNNVDSLGRDSDKYALKNVAAGCSDPSERVNVEIENRSNFYSSSTLNAQGVSGYICSKYGVEDPQASMLFSASSNFSPDDYIVPDKLSEYNMKFREQQWLRLGDKVLHYLNLSGCL